MCNEGTGGTRFSHSEAVLARAASHCRTDASTRRLLNVIAAWQR